MATHPTGRFDAIVFDRPPGGGADIIRYRSGIDADLSVARLTTLAPKGVTVLSDCS